MYCRKCGNETPSDAIYCGSCGASVDRNDMYGAPDKTAYYMPYAEKSVGIALVLGILYIGLGHIYIGKLKRGAFIMLTGIALVAIMAVSFFSFIWDSGIWVILPIFSMASFILWVWNLFDVNKLTKEYNDCIRRTGNPPW